MFSNQSSILFIYILMGRYQVPQNPHGADCGHTKDCTHSSQHVRDNHNKLTPKVQHPEHTKKFVYSIEEALDHFEDQIGSLDKTIWTNTYKMLLNSYKEALTPIWNRARFTDVKIILKTIANKKMTSLTDMARKL